MKNNHRNIFPFSEVKRDILCIVKYIADPILYLFSNIANKSMIQDNLVKYIAMPLCNVRCN